MLLPNVVSLSLYIYIYSLFIYLHSSFAWFSVFIPRRFSALNELSWLPHIVVRRFRFPFSSLLLFLYSLYLAAVLIPLPMLFCTFFFFCVCAAVAEARDQDSHGWPCQIYSTRGNAKLSTKIMCVCACGRGMSAKCQIEHIRNSRNAHAHIVDHKQFFIIIWQKYSTFHSFGACKPLWTEAAFASQQPKINREWNKNRFYFWIKSWSLKIGEHSFMPHDPTVGMGQLFFLSISTGRDFTRQICSL